MVRVTIQENTAEVSVQEESALVNVGSDIVVRNPDEYTGITEVTPTLQAQTLPTKNKTMPDDVTVLAIPVNQALNESNGYTVWIGGI